MNRISKENPSNKPTKPYPDFPLFPHATRRWAKKIKGRIHYFGPWADPMGALGRYQEQRDDLYAGRTPRTQGEGLTLRELANEFLSDRQHRLDAGEITQRTWNDYHRSCEKIIAAFGRNRLVQDLRPADFVQLRNSLAKTLGPVALGNEVMRIRVAFNFAYQSHLVEAPIRYGPTFKRPSNKVLRQQRAKNPPKRFSADEIRCLLDNASTQMSAMIYLGINCGLGNGDLGRLPISAINFKTAWLNYPRPKTGVERTCPLWPETIAAIQAVMACRVQPKHEEDQHLLFVTKYGLSWYKPTSDNPISQEFRKHLNSTDLYRKGVGFYALRHSFETEAAESLDQVAVNYIMGHVPAANDMSAVYREGISNERLQRVTDHVRDWLFTKNTL